MNSESVTVYSVYSCNISFVELRSFSKPIGFLETDVAVTARRIPCRLYSFLKSRRRNNGPVISRIPAIYGGGGGNTARLVPLRPQGDRPGSGRSPCVWEIALDLELMQIEGAWSTTCPSALRNRNMLAYCPQLT